LVFSQSMPAWAANPAETLATASPIKHVVVVIGENAAFDEIFATYQPAAGQSVANLLSKGIITAAGQPGPNYAVSSQVAAAPQSQYYISLPSFAKTAFLTLPPPDLGGVAEQPSDTPANGAPPPFATVPAAAFAEPFLEPADLPLLTTGASGLSTRTGPDTRIANVTQLKDGSFQFTAKVDGLFGGLPYDAYSEDTYHRFYQMWQQFDCSASTATTQNPSGCLADLLPFVIVTFEGSVEGGQATSMGFYNVQQGDAPYLKSLADQYTLADNYHQAVMGGTGPNHIMMQTGDMFYFSDGQGNPQTPPAYPAAIVAVEGLPAGFVLSPIANPNPIPGTNNQYINDPDASLGVYTNCSDRNQPGVAAILDYLNSLPYHPAANCTPNTYYLINNFFPGFHPNGTPANPATSKPAADGSDFFFVPPQTVPTVGDALNAKNISWTFYGDGLAHALNGDPFAEAYCPICDAMQYTTSTFANPALRAATFKDSSAFTADVANGTLPAVSFLKPSGFVDGHPLSSKVDLFEAFLRSVVDQINAQPSLAAETAILVTWDEAGGHYDSGFIQPLDFFGDGPRTPFLVISPYTKGGRIVHTYYDHVSILKFIERNWGLAPLSGRSRDNLPNPQQAASNPYVPTNMPAIGDLWDLFAF
jgi:phospholipase C